MSSTVLATETLATMHDLLKHLGGIPANRVRLQPPPGTATERDVVRVHARDRRLCELVDGVLVEKPMGYYESFLAGVLIKLLGNFLDQHDLGIVAGESGMLRLAAGMVRIPDVSFVSWDRLPSQVVPRRPIPDLVPDLAIEVLSPGNTKREMARKLDDYFSAGVRAVWFLEPKTKTVQVFAAPDRSVLLRTKDTLEGGNVLPGFRVPVRKLFPQRKRKN